MLNNLQEMHIKRLTADGTGDLIGNQIANKKMEVSKNLQQNNSEIVTNEHDKGIPKEKYVTPEKMLEIINQLRSKSNNN